MMSWIKKKVPVYFKELLHEKLREQKIIFFPLPLEPAPIKITKRYTLLVSLYFNAFPRGPYHTSPVLIKVTDITAELPSLATPLDLRSMAAHDPVPVEEIE